MLEESRIKELHKENTFTIIMSTWNRVNILPNSINSVLNQTYKNFEFIIIDDGSTDGTAELLKKYQEKDPRIRVITHDKPIERVNSWLEGFRAAKNDWILHIDSDDEYCYGYLEILNWNINLYPEYKVFHYGAIVQGFGGTRVKPIPVLVEDEKEGMKHFDTNVVMGGSFAFHKDCLKNTTPLPPVDNVFDFADWFGEQVKAYWKERNLPEPVPKYNRDDRWCGNPWGNDYVLSWLLTRKYKSKILNFRPYIGYIRTDPWLYERSIVSGTMG
jgi:glycosyltransferase involved in cell wall biosynthesis